ncbi:ATP-binding cassette domain-containing protein, partial [Citrobacter sp. VF227]
MVEYPDERLAPDPERMLRIVDANGNNLKHVDLELPVGLLTCITGVSGSGKSTLLMVMAGLERPDSGGVVIEDTDLVRLDEDALARFRGRRIGIVFQAFHLVPTMTALENVALPLELADRPGALERARAELEAVGLGHRLHHYP